MARSSRYKRDEHSELYACLGSQESAQEGLTMMPPTNANIY